MEKHIFKKSNGSDAALMGRRYIMLGNFKYHNPTKLYFGNQSLQFLNQELPEYGHNVVLIYGGGSIEKNGIYQAVMDILTKNTRM